MQGVSSDKGGQGSFGFAYYLENKDKLDAVAIFNKEGKSAAPNPSTVDDGSYNPLFRPIFIYVSQESFDKKAFVSQFMQYYMENAPRLSFDVSYVVMPSHFYQAAAKRLDSRITGRVFGLAANKAVAIDKLMAQKGHE